MYILMNRAAIYITAVPELFQLNSIKNSLLPEKRNKMKHILLHETFKLKV